MILAIHQATLQVFQSPFPLFSSLEQVAETAPEGLQLLQQTSDLFRLQDQYRNIPLRWRWLSADPTYRLHHCGSLKSIECSQTLVGYHSFVKT